MMNIPSILQSLDPSSPTCLDFGLIEYDECYKLQVALHDYAHSQQWQHPIGIICEHPAVFTLGKNGSKNHLLWDERICEQLGIAVRFTDRGGQITLHNPGQLVFYVICPVKRVRRFVESLEDLVIQLLDHWNIESHRDENRPGVWVGEKKICSIGIRMRKGYCYHGLALNVENDLSLFKAIHPCGFQSIVMTRMSDLTEVSMDSVKSHLRYFFKLSFPAKLGHKVE